MQIVSGWCRLHQYELAQQGMEDLINESILAAGRLLPVLFYSQVFHEDTRFAFFFEVDTAKRCTQSLSEIPVVTKSSS